MTFNPALKFEVLSEFDPSKPFDKVSEFDPSKSFEKIEEKKTILSQYVPTPKKPISEEEVVNLIWKELKHLPKPKPQVVKVIEKEIIREVKREEKKETKKEDNPDLDRRIKELTEELEKIKRFALFTRGGSGVIGIPPPEPNPTGYVLTVNSDKKAQWKASSGSGGSSPDVYTTSNVTTTRTLDPTTSTIDNLYNALASLIISLQGAGIIQ